MRFAIPVALGFTAAFLPTASIAEVTKIPAGDVTQELTCPEAQAAYGAEVAKPTATPERILLIMAAVNRCGAEAYNTAQKANHSPVRAIPTAHVEDSGGSKKVIFDLVTLSPKDAAGLRQVCGAAAGAAGVVYGKGDPILTPVLTEAGEFSCGSYVTALMNNSKLLIVAPTLIPGIAITEKVLRGVGVSEADINNAKKFLENAASTATNAAGTAAAGGVTVASGGVIVIDPRKPLCPRIMGHKTC